MQKSHVGFCLHPSVSESTILFAGVPSGPCIPGNAIPGHHTIQKHIFAPPIIGAPVRKTSTVGQILALLRSPAVASLNSAGQRICRQCRHSACYKDGKRVENGGDGAQRTAASARVRLESMLPRPLMGVVCAMKEADVAGF
ncbi:hypothetical protein PHLGIDRAFT_19742 [Phlebiopsis gigantea 11061_1 CR5-6]|uniref:Uncharacterized protein n=1 Tax=Phlebiopsis gigantea (strain 11061_1 CR5-6) TaxID=745531 RepID=A0A0C3PHI2_PHLG1|nr:hypothetical protein PHLGIDRAFT_19742 [Phlebiopsis gigantea 11061_1 CR5-6]